MEQVIPKPDNVKQEIVFSPSALINVFNNALTNEATRKTFLIKGRYYAGKGTEYSGYYYDQLKDENTDASMTLIVPSMVRHNLHPGQTIECHAYLTKKVQLLSGRIELQLNLVDIISQKKTEISEDEIKAIELLQQKAQQGFADLDSFIKARIIASQKVSVTILVGRTGIIDSDIKHQLKEAIGFYDFRFAGVSLTGEAELVQAIRKYGEQTDILCVARGGGENIEFFNRVRIAEAALSVSAVFVTAIGHKEDVTLLQKVADKAFITPTALGQYFNEIYNQTIEELQQSKARLVEQITTQLRANYDKQVLNLNETIRSNAQLYEKYKQEIALLHSKDIEVLRSQVENMRLQSQTEIAALKRIADEREKLISSLQSQQTRPFSYGWIIVLAVAVVLVLVMKMCK